jgi:hypothetical protein
MFDDILGKDKEYLSPAELNQQKIDEVWAEEEYNETMLEQVSEYGDMQ